MGDTSPQANLPESRRLGSGDHASTCRLTTTRQRKAAPRPFHCSVPPTRTQHQLRPGPDSHVSSQAAPMSCVQPVRAQRRHMSKPKPAGHLQSADASTPVQWVLQTRHNASAPSQYGTTSVQSVQKSWAQRHVPHAPVITAALQRLPATRAPRPAAGVTRCGWCWPKKMSVRAQTQLWPQACACRP